MKGTGHRNVWLRMTDSLGLTEPGKRPETPGPRLLWIQTIGWSASTLLWIVMLIRGQQGHDAQILYGVLIVLSLVLAVGNFVMLRRAIRRGTDNSKAHDGP
jgi:hypothetical protein